MTKHGLGIQIGGYIVCALCCQYLLGPAAATLARWLYALGNVLSVPNSAVIEVFYAGNWFWFHLAVGIVAGFFAYGSFPSVLSLLVWIPSGTILLHRVITRPRSILLDNLGTSTRYFLSTGCKEISLTNFYISMRCADQFHYSLPFYAAIGFSIGAGLRHLQRAATQPDSHVLS